MSSSIEKKQKKITCDNCSHIMTVDLAKLPKSKVKGKCKKCGKQIVIDNSSNSQQKHHVSSHKSQKSCPKCNTLIEIGDTECSSCGIIKNKHFEQKLEKGKTKPKDHFNTSSKEKVKTRPIFIFSIIGLLSVIIIFAYPTIKFFFSSSSGTSQSNVSITLPTSTSYANQNFSSKSKIDKSVFGIEMGETFITQIPECPELELGKFPTGPCYEARSSTDIVSGFIEVKLYNRPSFVKSIFTQLYNGKVESLTIYLNGREFEEEALHSLIKKWGEPTISEVVSLTNGFGAQITSFEAHWVMEDLSCFFSPATDSKRVIAIYTSYGSKMLSEKVEKIQQEEAKL